MAERPVGAASWDAVIVGASFGGLAAALELAGAGRVLIVDHRPVGEGQTSACAAPLPVLERLDLLDCVEQIHDHAVAHLPGGGAHPFRVRHSFATFDYRRFCRRLFERTGARFLMATATGLAGPGVVRTSVGELRGRVLVDASGWRAVLGPRARGRAPSRPSVGLEVRMPGGGDGLHFWLHDPAMRDGYLWDFPAGGHRRVGIIAYGASGGLRGRLEGFAGRLDCLESHGGGLPARLRDPVQGGLFRVGDAAGQCLPLTGEGIRPALVFGTLAGRLARRVLTGSLGLEEALVRYRRLVRRSRFQYAALSLIQAGVGRVPLPAVAPLSWLVGRGPLSWPAERGYWSAAPQEVLRAEPGRDRGAAA